MIFVPLAAGFSLSLSRFFCRNAGASLSLLLQLPPLQPAQPLSSSPSPLSSLPLSQQLRQRQQQQPPPQQRQQPLPTPFPATTGNHFRRHHDQENHLDILYTRVLTVKPFIKLEKPQDHCSSSSRHATGSEFHSPLVGLMPDLL